MYDTALQTASVCCTNLNEQHMQRFATETPYYKVGYNLEIAIDNNYRKLVPLVVTLDRKVTISTLNSMKFEKWNC